MKNFKLNHHTILQCCMVALIALALTGLNACCIPKEPTPPDYRIKTTTDERFVLTILSPEASLEYNTDGRLKRTYDPGSNTDVKTYTYTQGQVNVRFKFLDNYSDIQVMLNAEGYVSSFPTVGDFDYDPQGHTIKWIDGESVTNYTYDAYGNLTKEEELKTPANIILSTTTYTYTNDLDLRQDGLDWLYGKRSTYLAASKTTYGGSTTTNGVTETYTYVLDNHKRVTLMTITEKGRSPKNYTYTYFN